MSVTWTLVGLAGIAALVVMFIAGTVEQYYRKRAKWRHKERALEIKKRHKEAMKQMELAEQELTGEYAHAYADGGHADEDRGVTVTTRGGVTDGRAPGEWLCVACGESQDTPYHECPEAEKWLTPGETVEEADA